jgi:hypothetical protein
MLSAEKAKLKSALDKTKSQIQSEVMLKNRLIHTLGININFNINFAIFRILPDGEGNEFIADFKKSWFMVSQRLVKRIRNKVKTTPSFIIEQPLSL